MLIRNLVSREIDMIARSFLASAMLAGSIVGANALIVPLTGNGGPLAINGAAISENFFFAGGGAARLNLALVGNNSVDGNNTYQDDFEFKLNGVPSFRATFDLGG